MSFASYLYSSNANIDVVNCRAVYFNLNESKWDNYYFFRLSPFICVVLIFSKMCCFDQTSCMEVLLMMLDRSKTWLDVGVPRFDVFTAVQNA